MIENEELILEIKRMGINGEGIAFYKKKAVFIDNAIKGELVKVKIISESEKMAKGEIIEIIKPSPNRVTPPCPYFDKCGGCQLMHIDYEYQKVLKRDLIIDSINRYTKLNTRSFEIKDTISLDDSYHYRNKSSLPVCDFNGKSVVGMIDPETLKITYIEDCLVQDKRVNEVNLLVLELIDKLKISIYNKKFNRGVVKFLVTRVSNVTNTCQVTIVCHEKSSKIYKLADELILNPLVSSIYENLNDSKKSGIIFSNNFNHLKGDEVILMKIGNISYNLKPQAFFQLNTKICEILNERIKKACKLSKKEVVLDLYCGVGSIGLYIANMAKEVIGIEFNKEAVNDANNNKINNKIDNITFYNADVSTLLPDIIKKHEEIDVCIVDPPRTGIGSEVIEVLNNLNLKRLIYVSCNPSTLAKDLNLLSSSYSVNYIEPIDMFMHTAKIESLVVLTKNK